jgi:fibronectin-binding autotransporter adhesin
MNSSSFLSKISGAALAAFVFSLLLAGIARAQDHLYFDPTDTGAPSGSGGSGSFPNSDYYDQSTGTEVAGFVTGDEAYFDGPAGDVTVDSAVSPVYLEVGVTSGTETFGTGTPGNITTANSITLGPIGNAFSGNPYGLNPINIDAGTENVAFNSNLNLNIEDQYYGNGVLNDATSGNLAFNGGLTFTNNTTNATDSSGNSVGQPNLILNATAGGTFTINSEVNLVSAPGSQPVQNGNNPNVVIQGATGATAIATLATNAVFDNVSIFASANSIVYDQGATYNLADDTGSGNGLAFASGGGEYLADTADMTVQTTVEVVNGIGIVGSDLAAVTTFSGNSNPHAPGTSVSAYNGGTPYLTAAAGGRVNFTGDVFNGDGGSVYKIGAGTVNMDDTGAVRAEDQRNGWEIQNGTLLADATNAITGSGVMIDQVATSALVPGTQTYATLGGVGSVSAPVTAAGANSSITPGDPTINNGIGTLTLASGLTASSGVTFNLTLDGAKANGFDTVAFNGSNLTLGGTVTFNFTNMGGKLDSGPYDVLTGFSANTTGGSSLDTAAYILNAPAGYVATLDPSDLLPGATNFAVDFTAVPEPSTWALIGLSGLGLVGFGKFRKLRA